MKLVWATVLVLCSLCHHAYSKDCSLYEGFAHSRCFTGQDITKVLANRRVAWVVEFYSSWCGHCQHFAPTWKEIAIRVEKWSSLVKLGQIDCTQSDSKAGCNEYDITAYPSIMFFNSNPTSDTSDKPKRFTGGRSYDTIVQAVINHIEAQSPQQPWLQPLVAGSLEGVGYDIVLVLVFEDSDSYIGKEIALDYLSKPGWTVRRVLRSNVGLVQHYLILEFPSLVLQSHSGSYSVIPSPGKDIVKHFEMKANEFMGVKQDSESKAVAKEEGKETPTAAITRPHLADISSAISYALRSEVPLHHVISEDAFLALYKLILHMEEAFQLADSSISANLKLLRIKLESKNLGGFIFTTEWHRILETKLDANVFPLEPHWKSCQGSKPHLRGFPCGLWTLMHTLTVLSLPSLSQETHPLISSRAALEASVGFVKNFFSCEECRTHFTEMAVGLRKKPISYEGDAILWLWEAHNIVNVRLKDDPSSDPQHPKALFPPYKLCPYCYTRGRHSLADSLPDLGNVGFRSGESLLPDYHNLDDIQFTWNRTAVLLFLINFYGMGQFNNIPRHQLVSTAWPIKHQTLSPVYSRKEPPRNMYCIQLVICVSVLFLCAFYLLRRHFIRSPRFKYM